MNILFYFDHQINPERGGTERVSDLLARLFIRQGYSVCYLAKYNEYPQGEIPTYFLPDPDVVNSNSNIHYVEKLVSDLNIGYIINQGTNGPDICLFNHKTLNVRAKIISCLHFSIFEGLQYFKELLPLQFNISHPISFLKDCIRFLLIPYNKNRALNEKRKRYRFIYENTDKIVVLSPQYKEDYESLLDFRDNLSKICSIPNPLTFEVRNDKTIRKKRELLFVGRLSYAEKRVDRLLKTWRLVQDKFPDWSLNIVGDGPDRKRLESIASSLGLERLTFRGFCSPEEYYRRSKILCITSTHEGFPMVLLEAMQYGVVPVAFDSFGAARQIVTKDAGMLVSPFNIEEYAEALSSLMSSDSLWKKYSLNCVSSVLAYQPDRIFEYWKNLFEELSLL